MLAFCHGPIRLRKGDLLGSEAVLTRSVLKDVVLGLTTFRAGAAEFTIQISRSPRGFGTELHVFEERKGKLLRNIP